MEKTNIYFVGSTELMVVKIGKSDDPVKRLSQLQTGTPHKLTLFRIFKNVPADCEYKLHKKFSHLRKQGEWFQLNDELLHFMINKQHGSKLGSLFDESLTEIDWKWLDNSIKSLFYIDYEDTQRLTEDEVLDCLTRNVDIGCYIGYTQKAIDDLRLKIRDKMNGSAIISEGKWDFWKYNDYQIYDKYDDRSETSHRRMEEANQKIRDDQELERRKSREAHDYTMKKLRERT